MNAKTRPTTADVAANLHAHEVKCEERWKTIFSETADIKKEIDDGIIASPQTSVGADDDTIL